MTDNLPSTTQTTDEKRQLALLKAIGLDRAAPEQREIALHIANRYDLDLLLKHLVLIEGRPFITRDGLLHIAHRSGQLDGIETSVPEVVNDEWRVTCSVYRKDMGRPFTYAGRYPTKGGNQKFAPEMATKVAESMALRRAFDVAAPTQDERWDLEVAAPAPPKPSLAEVAREKAAAASGADVREPEPEAVTVASSASEGTELGVCGAEPGENPLGLVEACGRDAGHVGPHSSSEGSWPQ